MTSLSELHECDPGCTCWILNNLNRKSGSTMIVFPVLLCSTYSYVEVDDSDNCKQVKCRVNSHPKLT